MATDRYRIIAAYAGTGKTTFAAMYPEIAIDFVTMQYKYYLEPDDSSNVTETSKANPNNIMRWEWPFNYVEAIRSLLNETNKILLIPSDSFVLELLRYENIPYTLCYPRRDAKDVYRRRFVDRGNTERFLAIFIDEWDSFLDSLESDPSSSRIIMEPHQFLCDVIDIQTYYG